jgi:hypothetical protein
MRPANDAAPVDAGALLVAAAAVGEALVGDGLAAVALAAAGVGDIGEDERLARAPSAEVSTPCPVSALLAGSDATIK